MKMAKASQADLDAALELYQFLEAMRDGRKAVDAVEEFGFAGYDDLVRRGATDNEFLLRAHDRGGLMRVAFGMQVLLDPRNEIVDPSLDHLALHPKLAAAGAALTKVADALFAALQKFPAEPSLVDVAGDLDGASTTEWMAAAVELATVSVELSRSLAPHRTTADVAATGGVA